MVQVAEIAWPGSARVAQTGVAVAEIAVCPNRQGGVGQAGRYRRPFILKLLLILARCVQSL